MTQRHRNYALLLVLFTVAAVCHIGSSVAVINGLRFGTQRARQPLHFGFLMRAISGLEAEAQRAGIRWGDVLEEAAGQRFIGEAVLESTLSRLHPGDFLPVVVRQAAGNRLRASIELAP